MLQDLVYKDINKGEAAELYHMYALHCGGVSNIGKSCQTSRTFYRFARDRVVYNSLCRGDMCFVYIL